MAQAKQAAFITGATGYIGSRLIPELRALVRPGSKANARGECAVTVGDVLNSRTFAMEVPPADTFIHLAGVPRPAPWKGDVFRAFDLPSVQASLAAAQQANVAHFIYISVAQPAPVMKAYVPVSRDRAIARKPCTALVSYVGSFPCMRLKILQLNGLGAIA